MGCAWYYLIDKGVINKDVEEWGTGQDKFRWLFSAFIKLVVCCYDVPYEQAKKNARNQIDYTHELIDLLRKDISVCKLSTSISFVRAR